MYSSDLDRMDSLDGWVAIRNDIFEDTERYKMGFLVQWSEMEGKFAVICHNRTLQQKRNRDRKDTGDGRDGETSWAGMFSGSELKHIHQQLSGCADLLSPYLPDLSGFTDPGLLGSVLFSRTERLEHQVETVCVQLEKYFNVALDVCGATILLDVLFGQQQGEVEEERYCENLLEFKRRAMEEQVKRAKQAVHKIVRTHSAAAGLVQLMKIYEEEDEAYGDLVTIATQFYQHLLQPFRDMRELSTLRNLEIRKCLEVQELGPKRVCELEKEMVEWNRRGNEAVCSIQDVTVCYFSDTTGALSGMLKQMEADRKRFGSASWSVAMPRLERLKFQLAKETLQLMRAKELCVSRRKQDIKDKMGNVSEGSSVCEVDVLELQYYEAQLEMYDCKLEILKNEELLLLTQIHTLQREIRELKEEVVYYDACEDPTELQCIQAESSPAQSGGNPAHKHLQQRLQQLERKRTMTSSRRATLRTRKESCIEAHELQQRATQQRVEQHQQHHTVHLKRERRKEEEEKRKDWVQMERERTISRLRSFREKNNGQFVMKSRCPRPNPHDSPVDDSAQPMSIISLTPPTQARSTTPRGRGRGRGQKQRDIPVQILLPPGGAGPERGLTPPSAPPPPPPPPPPPVVPPPPIAPPPLVVPSPLRCEGVTADPPTTGLMDDVLASLQRGRAHLRKVTPSPAAPPTKTGNLRDDLLSAIRQGVTLKKTPIPRGPAPSQNSELEQRIRAAMLRMKRVSNESDEEDEEQRETPMEEWDS